MTKAQAMNQKAIRKAAMLQAYRSQKLIKPSECTLFFLCIALVQSTFVLAKRLFTEETMPKRLNFDKLRESLQQLSLEQARQLYTDLSAVVQALEQKASSSATVTANRREVLETKNIGDRFYQLERIRCGKVGCKCAGEHGELHGPYWYAYWRDDEKLRSRYVGKRLRQVE